MDVAPKEAPAEPAGLDSAIAALTADEGEIPRPAVFKKRNRFEAVWTPEQRTAVKIGLKEAQAQALVKAAGCQTELSQLAAAVEIADAMHIDRDLFKGVVSESLSDSTRFKCRDGQLMANQENQIIAFVAEGGGAKKAACVGSNAFGDNCFSVAKSLFACHVAGADKDQLNKVELALRSA